MTSRLLVLSFRQLRLARQPGSSRQSFGLLLTARIDFGTRCRCYSAPERGQEHEAFKPACFRCGSHAGFDCFASASAAPGFRLEGLPR